MFNIIQLEIIKLYKILINKLNNNLLTVVFGMVWTKLLHYFIYSKYNTNYIYYDQYTNPMYILWALEFVLIIIIIIYTYTKIINLYNIKNITKLFISLLTVFIFFFYKQSFYVEIPLILILFLIIGIYLFEILSIILSIVGIYIIFFYFNKSKQLNNLNQVILKKYIIVYQIIIITIIVIYLTNIFFFNMIFFILIINYVYNFLYIRKKKNLND